jgi:hypothetical protein
MTSTLAHPEDPPGFVVRTEAQKAAWDNGYRLERGIDGGWLRYGSTTAPESVWIAGVSSRGPWLLSIDHSGVIAEIGALPASCAGQLRVTYMAQLGLNLRRFSWTSESEHCRSTLASPYHPTMFT